jgi:hypothetical protein
MSRSPQSFEGAIAMADAYSNLSPQARRIVKLLSQLPAKMNDPAARSEARGFLSAAREAGADMLGVERALVVLNAYEGVLGGEEGDRVRVIG